MPNPMIRIHNVETDEIIDREMTAEEFAAYKLEIDAAEEIRAERESKSSAKVALLDRLGISAEEANLLLS